MDWVANMSDPSDFALASNRPAKLAERVAEPVDGHPVLMVCRGRLQHIGVACRLAGEWWVLHADEDFGAVIRQRLRDLPPVGIKVEGFYRWKTIA